MSESDVQVVTTHISDPNLLQAQNRGPITTLFSPPSSCTATLTTQQPPNDWMFFGHWLDPYFDVACFPLGTLRADDLVTDRWEHYYYSPAICPQGWSTATTFGSEIIGGDATVLFVLGPETTAALCCPSGYAYYDLGHQCASSVTRNQRVPYVSPTNIGIVWDRGSVSMTTMAAETTIFGDGVQIWWQSSDEALLSAAAATTSAPSTKQTSSPSTHSLTSTPTSTPTRTPTNGPSPAASGGLSTGAKGGVGGGIAAAVVIAGIVLTLLFLRRKKKARAYTIPNIADGQSAGEYAHHGPQDLPVWVQPAKSHGTNSHVRAGY